MAEGGKSSPSSVHWFCQCFRSSPRDHNEREVTIHNKMQGQQNALMADWTMQHDLKSQWKRSDMFHASVRNQDTEQLRAILETGWEVNEILEKLGHVYFTTTLHAAARQGWTEGVQLLCAAGAKYMTPGTSDTPLQLALQNHGCSVDMVRLLLKHGAGPKLSKKDAPCLGLALLGMSYSDNFRPIVRLLLENGADPNVAVKVDPDWLRHFQSNIVFSYVHAYELCPLAIVLILLGDPVSDLLSEDPDDSSCKDQRLKILRMQNAEIFKMLADYGVDVSSEITGMGVLLHMMTVFSVRNELWSCYSDIFLPQHLDVLFKSGRDINMPYSDQGTALEFSVRNLGQSNNVRWLLRHGADVPPSMIVMLEEHLAMPSVSSIWCQQVEETLLILLQAGMRCSHGVYMHLMEIENTILAWQEHIPGNGDADDRITLEASVKTISSKLVKEVEKGSKKQTLKQYLSTQMSDLEEFSDASLLVYPEIGTEPHQTEDIVPFLLAQIHKMLEFLSQTQSLQWYCRRCVRESLVSLQPSVVKTLPIPPPLKRYILCHEL